MSPMQQRAWFSLAVIALTVLTVAILTPILGIRAQGGFGVLGLLGLGEIYFWRLRRRTVVADERDDRIQHSSAAIAYTVLWLSLVAAALFAAVYYGKQGAVPVVVVQIAVWIAFILVFGVMSIAALVQYGRTPHAE